MPEHVTERQREAAGRFASMFEARVKEAVFASLALGIGEDGKPLTFDVEGGVLGGAPMGAAAQSSAEAVLVSIANDPEWGERWREALPVMDVSELVAPLLQACPASSTDTADAHPYDDWVRYWRGLGDTLPGEAYMLGTMGALTVLEASRVTGWVPRWAAIIFPEGIPQGLTEEPPN